jgi:pyruvate,water dikinase
MTRGGLSIMSEGITSAQLVYFFGAGQAEGGGDLKHLVGGKGASLADMTKAGLNVPPGFTISAACCDEFHRQGGQWPNGLEDEVRASLHRLETLTGRIFGHGDHPLLVAVRSGAAVSMPGMMDTVLNVGRPEDGDSWNQLRRAIEAVFHSWNSERAVLYRRHHQIGGLLGTAVTVQAMCPAEVSGVLFTADPVDPSRQQIVIEAVPGLGEALVLGKVTPNRYTMERPSLHVLDRALVHDALLSDDQLAELGRLGLRVESYFGHPCDIEWAWSGGQFYSLQSRPIRRAGGVSPLMMPRIRGLTPPARQDMEQVRQAEITALRARAEPGGTVWARFNLCEILPAPTPMTWAIVRRFMSGRGGFGLMYRDLGFDPDPALDEEGVYDLICGRPYCNLSREPRLHFRLLPFAHNFAALKAAPHKALYPQPTIDTARAGWRFWLFAPIIIPRALVQMIRAELRQREIAQSLPKRLREEVFPSFAAETAKAAAQDLTRLDEPALLERLEEWTRRTLVDFARDSLKPTALAGLAMGKVERLLLPTLGPERTRAAVGELVMGVHPDPEADLPRAMQELAAGKLQRETFLARFGHRGSQEMELSQPRWSEAFSEPPSSTRLTGASEDSSPGYPQDNARARLPDEAKLSPAQRAALTKEIESLHTFLALRETAKHYLMMGYAEVRRVQVELDRRHGLNGGIFFLEPAELPRLVQGEDLSTLIAERRRRREIALSLEVPQVLFSDDLEVIGRPVEAAAAETLRGVALSAGVGEGEALVLHTPDASALPAEPYILVCPSTDPAWLPLFVRAKGLVMETGGVLSHGAIVAREFGLPAVAGLADVHHRIRNGQRLRVDGGAGTVAVLSLGEPGVLTPG